jgi:hypothetical protein
VVLWISLQKIDRSTKKSGTYARLTGFAAKPTAVVIRFDYNARSPFCLD